jgi:hypothetical protein
MFYHPYSLSLSQAANETAGYLDIRISNSLTYPDIYYLIRTVGVRS